MESITIVLKISILLIMLFASLCIAFIALKLYQSIGSVKEDAKDVVGSISSLWRKDGNVSQQGIKVFEKAQAKDEKEEDISF